MATTTAKNIQTPALVGTSQVSWRVAGAAVQGISHLRSGLPCQDAQSSRVLENGMLLVALADGAGSAQYSDHGAQRAVQTALDRMSEMLEQGPPADWGSFFFDTFGEAREAVLRLAGEFRPDGEDEFLPARAYACTLTCVVAAPDILVAGQVGDGAVVAGAMDKDAPLITVTRLQRGEYANETHFLVQDDALEQLTIDVIDLPVSRLAVMSDGLIRLALKMPSQDPHEPFFAPLFRFAEAITEAGPAEEQLAQFLNSERVNARTDDDKSLVLAVRAAPPVQLQAQRNLVEKPAAKGSLDRFSK